MRIAVLSDIHANMEALEAVLADADAVDVGRIISLGDNVGYGPDPEKVVRKLQERNIPSVLGNHELALIRPEHLEWFNPSASQSLQTTARMISEETMRHLSSMEKFLTFCGGRFVHGFPPDSPLKYLFQVSETELLSALKSLPETICFVGHTHDLVAVGYDGAEISRTPLPFGRFDFNPQFRYIVNAGSVGQPRERDKRAKYVVWDTERHALEVRFIEYDAAKTAEKITRAGLPEVHAKRLLTNG